MAIRDKFNFNSSESSFCLDSTFSDKFGCKTGEIFYSLCTPGQDEVRQHIKNTVTLDAGILLARIMKGPNGVLPNQMVPSFGVLALAVGTGDLGWNPLFPPPATNTQRSLYNEIARKALVSTSFIGSNGSVVTYPTNVTDLTVTFGPSEAVGAITEMGLIGGDANSNVSIRNPILPANGSYDPTVDVTGKDCLVNYVTFPAISKSPASTLSFTWRLTF